jgi:hypothetical protein
MVDGCEETTNKLPEIERTYDVFDYEGVISVPELIQLRAKNLVNFLRIILEDVILLNFDKTLIDEQKTKCKHFFSNEIVMVTLKSYYKLAKRSATNLKKRFPGERFNQDIDYKVTKAEFED